MIKTFLLMLTAGLLALLLALVLTIASAEWLSARQAGQALVWLAMIDLAIVAAATWGFRALGRRGSGRAPPWWSSLLLALLAGFAALALLLFAMLALNR